MVPEDSSAARMPRPGATMASATLLSSARFIEGSVVLSVGGGILPPLHIFGKGPMAPRSISIDFHRFPQSGGAQHLDARQRLAFEPLQKGAAGGRDIGEPLGHAGAVERGDRVAAACDRYKLSGGSEFRRG